MTERTGQLFGNYRLTRMIGQGGFADVYLGNGTQIVRKRIRHLSDTPQLMSI
jgi:hypothetical protein